MLDPKPDTLAEAELPTERRLSFDLAIDVWNELQLEAAQTSIAEGRSVAVSEVARRRIVAVSKSAA